MVNIKMLEKYSSLYIKGLPQSSEVRNIMNTLTTTNEVISMLEKYKKELINF